MTYNNKENNPMYGRKHSEESKKLMSEKKKKAIKLKVKRMCVCGKEFEHYPSAKRIYCSQICYGIYNSKENNGNWKGGIIFDRGRKLIYSPNHPFPDFLGKYCYEYRLVVEKHLGRFLKKDEVIHHINGDITDNRIENLQVMLQKEHIKLHILQGDMRRVVLHI